MDVLFCAPDPARRGGVCAAVDALIPALPEARRGVVGRRRGRPGAAALDPWRIRRDPADLAVFNPSLRPASLARDIALLAAWDRPAALWIHGGSPAAWRRLPTGLTRRLTRRAVLVVLADRFGARLIRKGAPADRVRVIPPPYAPSAIPARRRPGPVVLFLGRLVPDKDPGALLDAFARIAPAHPDLRLVLAGDGPLRPALADRARRLGLGARVDLPGWIDGPTRRAALARAAVLALPSRDEAVPLAVVEALAAGVPVVATEVGAVPETVGDAGIVVPPGDAAALARAVARLLSDPGARPERGRARAARHHPDAVAARWRRVFAELA